MADQPQPGDVVVALRRSGSTANLDVEDAYGERSIVNIDLTSEQVDALVAGEAVHVSGANVVRDA